MSVRGDLVRFARLSNELLAGTSEDVEGVRECAEPVTRRSNAAPFRNTNFPGLARNPHTRGAVRHTRRAPAGVQACS